MVNFRIVTAAGKQILALAYEDATLDPATLHLIAETFGNAFSMEDVPEQDLDLIRSLYVCQKINFPSASRVMAIPLPAKPTEKPQVPSGNIDELTEAAKIIVKAYNKASTSFLQRHMGIGYAKATELMGRLEEIGVVSVPNHVGRREVL
ncbi:DNA translocase FtsK [Komagataeibacter xylinus]|uniref:DNA translocase FtsK n=1 Tax=Komagataeibacter xylinus TaxID=28448 RepID=UPI00280B881F|nr:DNA translocase FtsK [Komagataeibacter xylinus]